MRIAANMISRHQSNPVLEDIGSHNRNKVIGYIHVLDRVSLIKHFIDVYIFYIVDLYIQGQNLRLDNEMYSHFHKYSLSQQAY